MLINPAGFAINDDIQKGIGFMGLVRHRSGLSLFPADPDLPVRVCDYGVMSYPAAMDVLQTMVAERTKNRIPDTLMILEHPPTYTLGLRAKTEHLLVSESELKRRNIELFNTDRGGDITFHGPGQLVGYPVLDLKTGKPGIRQYINRLENVIIRAIAGFGVAAHRNTGFPGVWSGSRKIAAIGIRINAAGISSHGFAINVNTDLTFFQHIIPCGLRETTVTSLAGIIGTPVDMEQVKQSVAKMFLSEFQA